MPHDTPPPHPAVTILMATCQGAAHLPAQLATIAAQRGVDWALWVSDDGSTDATRDILRAFRSETPRPVHLLEGPRRGAAANFLSLLCHPELPPGPVALCDQDDLWDVDKLARALTALAAAGGTPAVYAARSRHITEDGRPCGGPRPVSAPPGFGNALVQNRVPGHAAVLNAAGLALLRTVGPVEVPFHDWWLYLLLTGAGGRVICDPVPAQSYRQHGGNLLGAHSGPRALAARLALALGPRGPALHAANRAALARARPWLTPEARALLDGLATAPRFGPGRRRALRRLGLRRDSPAAELVLGLAATLGRA